MPSASRIARGVAIGAGAIAYAVLAHLTNSSPGHEALGALLAAGPVWIAAVVLASRSRHRWPGLIACLLVAVLVYVRWPDLEAHFAWLYLVQQAGTYAVLGVIFGRTLGAGRTPLCSRFAAAVHGPLQPEVAAYTRSVTLAWTLFFAALTLALVLLFVVAPRPVWSAFANFGTAILIALMFATEYLIRRRRLPDMRHDGLLQTLRAVSSVAIRDAIATPRA